MKSSKALLMISLIIVVVGCGSVSRSMRDDHIIGNIDGMEKVETQHKQNLVYKLAGFKLEEYSKFKIIPVRTLTGVTTEDDLSVEDRSKIEKYLRDAVRRELTEAGYGVVDVNGPDVLGIRFTFTDVDSGNAYLNVLQFVSYGVSYDTGGISIETEFFDTMNNKAQAIAVIGADGARMFNGKSVSGKWADVERVFDDWAAGFREELDKNNKDKKLKSN